MSDDGKDGQITYVRFKEQVTLHSYGTGLEWAAENGGGYEVRDTGSDLVFWRTIGEGADAGRIARINVPRENIAFVLRLADPVATKDHGVITRRPGKEAVTA